MKKWIVWVLACCLLLSGCSTWLEGSYHSVTPHQEKENDSGDEILAVSSYNALCRTLAGMVEKGTLNAVISVKNYNQLVLARDMRNAIDNLKKTDPVGAYAVENIEFDLGTNAGQPAMAVNITYYADRMEPQKIQYLEDMSQAEQIIGIALSNCETSVALHVKQFESRDFVQWVKTFSDAHPLEVMERPEVVYNIYPEDGAERVLELKFTYQNSRESLRFMQEQVKKKAEEVLGALASAENTREKYRALYDALAESFTGDDASNTPAYSLLVRGAADSEGVSKVFAALCARAELDCALVSGTRQGEPWHWNKVTINGASYHLDVLRCLQEGSFRLLTESQMAGYAQ